MSDITDDIIETLCRAREQGLSRDECTALVADTFAAPWSDTPVAVNNHGRRRRWRTMLPRSPSKPGRGVEDLAATS